MKIYFGLFGAGGFGREVMPYVKRSVCRSLQILDNQLDIYFVETDSPRQTEVNGYPLISIQDFINLEGSRYFNVAVGNGHSRHSIEEAVGNSAKLLSICAEQVIHLDNNSIGEGAVFCPNTMVTSNVSIGRMFQANIYSYVAHDCKIGNYVTFAPGVRCNGRVHIGDYAYIGTNAIIKQGTIDNPLYIGRGATIGMGAVVTKDVADGAVVVGNPARELVR